MGISDSVGYDFQIGEKCYEVKGHLQNPSFFILSANEWKVAQALGENFSVVGIVLHPSPRIAYIYHNLAQYVSQGELTLESRSFNVRGKK